MKDIKQHTIDSLMDYWRGFTRRKFAENRFPVNYRHMILHEHQKYGLIKEIMERGLIGSAGGHQGVMLPMGIKVYFTTDISDVDDIIILTD